MNFLNIPDIVRQIARLAVASDSFQQIIALLDHITELKLEISSELYSPMMAGIVTTYSRNFNSSAGMGLLPRSYTKFPDANMAIAHEKIIESKNKIYAHRDATHDSAVQSNSEITPYRIFVELKPTLDGFNFTPVLPEIPPDRIPDIRTLVKFQHKRIIKDLSEKNELITDFSKEYELGKIYEWGVDLPLSLQNKSFKRDWAKSALNPLVQTLDAMEKESTFISELKAIHPKNLIELLQADDQPDFCTFWKLRNEIKPVDLYCYLFARFGPPNGIQNFLRGDHSENLVHWEWALRSEDRIFLIQGQNYRTELWVSGNELPPEALKGLVSEIKSDFAEYGPKMGKVRKALEHWVEFINPYQRIRRSIESLTKELESLDLNDNGLSKKDLADYEAPEDWAKDWERQDSIYSRATGLCFGVRSMLPVMAEAFVNLLLYMLMKPALKKEDRLRKNLIRQPIDIRIRSLPNNCVGFEKEVDYSTEVCRRYQTLVNERNDLLHGNVVLDKLKFNEIYFNGRVPVFQSYSTMWDRAFGVSQRSVGLELLKQERETVESFIEYIISCLEEKKQEQIRAFCERHELGMCLDDGRLGILFSGQLVDMNPGPKTARDNASKKAN